MTVFMKPTGNIIKGHVLDCAVAPLEQALREYDAQLYIRWNPRKLKRWGCWEVRRKPEAKSASCAEVYDMGGYTLVVPEYKEIDVVNHVLDVPFLNYSVLGKIKKMDAWAHSYKGKDFVKDMEYREAKYDEKIDEQSADEMQYNLRQMKSEIKWLRDYISEGGNPYRLADYWK